MTRLPIDIHPEARSEQNAAFEWYLERSIGTAEAFFEAIVKARDAIQDSPKAWAEYLYGTRRYLLAGFPYLVVYRVVSHRIEVLAIAHGRRKPGYWARRLKSR